MKSLEEAVGRVTFVSLGKGEPIPTDKLSVKGAGGGMGAIIPKGMRAFTINTPSIASHVSGFILPGSKVEVWHDWLSGIGEATLDSSHRLLTYSGARTTYKVDVTRISEPANVQAIGAQFAARELKNGVSQLSIRDTARASIGGATFAVDYGRPLARGRKLLGDVVPFDHVWRTGANAATQFTTSAPITLAGIAVPPGTYTLWTVPRTNGGADLIVNKQSGQWGTEYDGARDLGMAHMQTETPSAPV